MHWFYIALIAPALWSITNHIDKYLVSKYFKGGGTGSLLIFSSAIGLFVVPIIFAFQPHVFSIHFYHALLLIINGCIYLMAVLPYIYALEKDEASIVVPLFQTVPVFSYILGFLFLEEVLTVHQISASALIIAGAIALSLDLTKKKPRFKKDVFAFMLVSSFLFALNSFIFKFVGIQSDFWTTSFWEYIGLSLAGIFLFVVIKSYRNQFLDVLKRNKIPVIGLNGCNEVINIVAKLCMNFATLLAPLALVWVVNGFQPFFVFFYGVLLTLFFPQFGTENIAKKYLGQKLLAIAVMFLGVYILYTS